MPMTDATAFADCRDCLCLASRSAARSITAAYDRHLRPHGVRTTQFGILSMLVLRGPTPITALATHLGMDRTTLTRNLSPLEREGWVQVKADGADARTRLVTLTARGGAVARDALPAWRRAQREVAEAVGVAGAATLRRLTSTPLP